MKITEQLEWDYETNKKTSTNFMTKDTIREIVACTYKNSIRWFI